MVASAAEKAGLPLSQLSEMVGKNAAYIQQWIKYNSPAKLPEDVRRTLAGILLIDEMELMLNTGATARFRPPPQLLGEADLPVYAAVEGGLGEMVVSTDAIDIVRRPWFLERIGDAYAVRVTGESMSPVYEPGDLVLVNPRLPPERHKDAIFVTDRLGGDFKAALKRYVRSTSTHWHAQQFSPPEGQSKDVTFAKKEWREALRVVGRYTP